MIPVADWSRRKQEIADAFRWSAPFPAEAEPEAYEALLAQIGVAWRPDGRRGQPRRKRHSWIG